MFQYIPSYFLLNALNLLFCINIPFRYKLKIIDEQNQTKTTETTVREQIPLSISNDSNSEIGRTNAQIENSQKTRKLEIRIFY